MLRVFCTTKLTQLRPRIDAKHATAMCGSTRLLFRSLPKRWDSVFALPYSACRIRPMAMPYSGLRNDSFLGQHYAWLLWRLLFLFYHRARRRIIQSRSEDSIINEIEAIRDTVPGFTGVISDLGGPTATCICCAANRHALNRPAAACRVFTRIFVRIWTLTTNRRLTSIAVRVI